MGAWLCARSLTGEIAIDSVTPEGLDDLHTDGAEPLLVQAKSRISEVGPFPPAAVAGFFWDLAERYERQCALGLSHRPLLVLERDCHGIGQRTHHDPLISLAPNHPARIAIIRRAEALGKTPEAVDAALRAISVLVLPWERAAAEAGAAVTADTDLPPAAAEVIIAALRDAIAAASDANAASTAEDHASLSRTRMYEITSEVIAMLDRDALDEARTRGLIEAVSFDVADPDARYFEGLDTQPSHIAAGLPAPRPALTGEVAAALESGTSVIVTGPSGVGKSTVIWSTAYSMRNGLWFRVRRLLEEDIEPIQRFVSALRPSHRTPVALVVDAIGTGQIYAWDGLVESMKDRPGVRLLGSARTEDLLTLRTLPDCTTMPVTLDAEVAAQIHAHLLAGGQTSVVHWAESFEQSGNLTLEFTHLLTQGRRLADVISDQVRRRVRERRDLEVAVLGHVGTAHMFGAQLTLDALQTSLQCDDGDLRAALIRLRDEHMIIVADGYVDGLHRLRSAELSRAVHSLPPPTLMSTVTALLEVLDEAPLQPFIAGVLAAHPEQRPGLSKAIANEILRRATPLACVRMLQACRIVDFELRASRWVPILDACGVPPALRPITAQFHLFGVDMDDGLLMPEIAAALHRLSTEDHEDSPIWSTVISVVGDTFFAEMVTACSDSTSLLDLLAVLAGADLRLTPAAELGQLPAAFTTCLRDASTDDLADLIAAAGRADPALQAVLVVACGGEAEILRRLHDWSPWLRDEWVEQRDGLAVACARFVAVDPEVQPDADRIVRQLAAVLLRSLPSCASVDVQVVTTDGEPLKFGDYQAGISLMPRRNDHPPSVVAWNRVRGHIAAAACGTTSATHRVSTASQLLSGTAQFFQSFLVIALRRRVAEPALIRQQVDLNDSIGTLQLPIERAEAHRVDADAAPSIRNDPVHALLQAIVANIPNRIGDGQHYAGLAALTGTTLVEHASKTRSDERWELLGQECPAALDQIETLLRALHDITAELAWGALTLDELVTEARVAPRRQVPLRLAELARRSADRRVLDSIDRIEQEAAAHGFPATVLLRPYTGTDRGQYWPQTELAVLLPITELEEWHSQITLLQNLLTQGPGTHRNRPPVLLAATNGGRLVEALAMKVTNAGAAVAGDYLATWHDHLPPPQPTVAYDLLGQLLQALDRASGYAYLASVRDLTADQNTSAQRWRERARQTATELPSIGGPADPFVTALVEAAAHLIDIVEVEWAQPAEAGAFASLMAKTSRASFSLGDPEPADEATTVLQTLHATALQWDLTDHARHRTVASE